jgi:hypothetical protein
VTWNWNRNNLDKIINKIINEINRKYEILCNPLALLLKSEFRNKLFTIDRVRASKPFNIIQNQNKTENIMNTKIKNGPSLLYFVTGIVMIELLAHWIRSRASMREVALIIFHFWYVERKTYKINIKFRKTHRSWRVYGPRKTH